MEKLSRGFKMLLDCDWIMLSANQHLASLYIPRKASYQESTTCSSESHEFESESSEMDQLSKVDQPGPLDLSTPKDSKNDPKQDSIENASMKKEIDSSSAPNVPRSPGSISDISKPLRLVTRRSSLTKIATPTNNIETSQTDSAIPKEIDSALDLRYFHLSLNFSKTSTFSLKSPSPLSTPHRKIISKRNISNDGNSKTEKLSDASILKRRRLSDEFRNDFGLEAEKSTLDDAKRLSRKLVSPRQCFLVQYSSRKTQFVLTSSR